MGLEARIRELRDAGELSGLPGEGQPLPPDPDAAASEAWAARHVLRTSGARPLWADLRRDITERRTRIADALAELNALMTHHNLVVTTTSIHVAHATLEGLLDVARASRG
jgi:hypothetical protein